MTKRSLYFVVGLLVLVLAGCTKNCPVADASSTPAPTAETQEEAIELLFETMHMEAAFEQMTDQLLEALPQQQPSLAQHKDVLDKFLHTVMAWENIKPEMVRFYADSFTKDEILDMVAFYGSDTGQKLSKLTPELTRRQMEVGQRLVQEHLPELMGMLLQAAKEDGQAPGQAPTPPASEGQGQQEPAGE